MWFDLKKATVRLCDGRKATLTTTAANGINARITLTDQSTHRGTQPAITIKLTDPGAPNQVLSIVVSGTDIEALLATNAGSAITTTAAQLKTAIEAAAAAAALTAVTLPGDGTGVVSAQVKTSLTTGARTLTLKVYEGTLSYTEHKNRAYVKDRGKLSTVRDVDEEPIDVKIDVTWEFITASVGNNPTPEDVLKNRGEAAAWVTTSADACEPFCTDMEVEYNVNCGGEKREFITFQSFRHETLEHNFKEGNVSVTGKCNVVAASVVRVT